MNRESFNRVLITGSNGMLGKDIRSILQEQNNYEIFGLNRKEDKSLDKEHSILCDITDSLGLTNILKHIKPNIIIHCAAMVNVDECENSKEYSYKLNAESTRILASHNPTNTKFVYISTDSVFDGKTGNYNEQDQTNPLNYYAFSKLKGEKFALLSNKNTMIIRTNIYGLHKHFRNSLVEWALDNLKKHKEISGFKDVYFNPVYTKQLGKIVIELIKMDYKGLIHIGCDNFINKYEFLLKLSLKFGISTELVNESSLNRINFRAKRPKNTTLDTTLFKNLTSSHVTIDDGLEQLYIDYNNIKER